MAFALRADFPWRRVPPYIVAQLDWRACSRTLLLIGLIGKQGECRPHPARAGHPDLAALAWEALLTTGLVSVVLGTASGAQQLGPVAAFGVGGYIALAGLFGAPVSGASMNPARSLGPALVARRLDVLVGVPGRAALRRDHRGRHRLRPARAWRRASRHPGRAGDARHALAADQDRPAAVRTRPARG